MCRERAQAAARSANVLCSLSDHFKEDWPIDQAWIYGLRWKMQRRVFARDRCAQIWGVLQSGVYSLVLVTQIASAPLAPPQTSCQHSFAAGRSIRHACPVRGVVDLAAAHSTQHRTHRSTGQNGNASQSLLLNLSLQTDPCRQRHVAQCPLPQESVRTPASCGSAPSRCLKSRPLSWLAAAPVGSLQ